MPTLPAQSLSRTLGRILQEIREQQGVRQDDVARAARAAGLRWTASSVAALETGRRELTADEACHLPAVLYRLGVVSAGNSRTSDAPPLGIRADADEILVTLCGRSLKQDTGRRWEKSLEQ